MTGQSLCYTKQLINIYVVIQCSKLTTIYWALTIVSRMALEIISYQYIHGRVTYHRFYYIFEISLGRYLKGEHTWRFHVCFTQLEPQHVTISNNTFACSPYESWRHSRLRTQRNHTWEFCSWTSVRHSTILTILYLSTALQYPTVICVSQMMVLLIVIIALKHFNKVFLLFVLCRMSKIECTTEVKQEMWFFVHIWCFQVSYCVWFSLYFNVAFLTVTFLCKWDFISLK